MSPTPPTLGSPWILAGREVFIKRILLKYKRKRVPRSSGWRRIVMVRIHSGFYSRWNLGTNTWSFGVSRTIGMLIRYFRHVRVVYLTCENLMWRYVYQFVSYCLTWCENVQQMILSEVVWGKNMQTETGIPLFFRPTVVIHNRMTPFYPPPVSLSSCDMN